jgi:hypothetical protein
VVVESTQGTVGPIIGAAQERRLDHRTRFTPEIYQRVSESPGNFLMARRR